MRLNIIIDTSGDWFMVTLYGNTITLLFIIKSWKYIEAERTNLCLKMKYGLIKLVLVFATFWNTWFYLWF